MTTRDALYRGLLELWHEAQAFVLSAGAVHSPVKDPIPAPSFFPGGLGLFSDFGLSTGSGNEIVMFVGQDFGTVDYANTVSKSGRGESLEGPTWKALVTLLKTSGIDQGQCYYTNALLGLRPGKAMTGQAPGWKDPALVAASKESLLAQIRLVQPVAIFALGLPAARFLGTLAGTLAPWAAAKSWAQLDARHPVRHYVPEFSSDGRAVGVGALLHPSFRKPNLHRRRFRGVTEEAAEAAIINETFNRLVGSSYSRLIASEQLRSEDIPAPSASWPEFSAFINTIEGIAVAGSNERLIEWTEGNHSPRSLDEARAMLYGHGRWMRWSEAGFDDWPHKREFFALLDFVRAEVAARRGGRDPTIPA